VLSAFDPRLTFDALAQAIVVAEASQRIVFVNAAASRLLGWPASEIEHQPLSTIVPHRLRADHGLAFERDLVSRQHEMCGRALPFSILKRDGTEVDVQLTLSVATDQTGAEWLVAAMHETRDRGELDRQLSITRYLRATTRAAARLGSRLDLEPTIETIVETLTADFDAALARIWLYEPSENCLRLEASAGWSRRTKDSQWGRIELASYPHKIAEVARTKVPFIKNGLEGVEDVDPEWVKSQSIASMACYPLVIAGELLGVLGYFSRLPLREEVVDALSAFVAIATSSIRDVQLFAREQAARVEAERERQRLQTVLDTIPVGVLLAEGPEGWLTMINPAGQQIGGQTVPMSSMDDFQRNIPLYHLDGRTMNPEERPLWRSIHLGEKVRETLIYHRPDGKAAILDVTCAPFPGPIGGAISTYRDVTDQRRVENELAERAAQLKSLLDHLPVGVMYFDSDAVCRACNGAARAMLGVGRPRAGITGVAAREVFAAAPVLNEALDRCLFGRAPQREPSVAWPDPEGNAESRFLDWRFEPLGVNESAPLGLLALIVDVTDRTRAEALLEAAKESAEAASRNKTRFLSAVSHDLRTPVNALSLLGELLGHLVAGRNDPGGELASLAIDIQQAASTLIELLNDLLELSRFDSGAQEIHRTPFGLDEWLISTLRPLEVTARAKGLAFRCRVDLSGRVIVGDRVKIGRVLTNLVGNAIKFTDRGRVDVNVGAARDGGLVLAVSDSGSGIPTGQIGLIFDEFAQLQNPERDRTKGTGLGLAICRRLVEAVGGKLSVESRLGSGSTFTAWYPPDHLEPVSSPSLPITTAPGSPPSRDATILLVEDDPHTRRAFSQLLGRAGYTVESAADGLAALESLDRAVPALVLLDLLMPGMDGVEVLRRVRDRTELSNLAILILSGDVDDPDRVATLNALGVTGYIPKPVNFDTVLEMVSRYAKTATH
jgi:PAS domain S-box-containing protein